MTTMNWKGTDKRQQDFVTPRTGKEAFTEWGTQDFSDGKKDYRLGMLCIIGSWVVVFALTVLYYYVSRSV